MDITELEAFKMSDAIKFHDELNPNLWNNDKLDPKVRKQLLLIAEDFITTLGIKDLAVKDITISGSNAAFTYTPHSDLDLHVLVDFNELPDNEVYQELFNAKKVLYNDAHDITVHGVPVELYVQDSNQPVVSLGEYSVLNDKWIRIPKKQKANLDQEATRAKFDKLAELVELSLQTRDGNRVNKTLDVIKRYRKAGLTKGGEFSPENLAFKAIRKQGGIQDLYDLKTDLHSEKLSIEEAASREDAISKIKKLQNLKGRTPAEIETTKNIIGKLLRQWNIDPNELGIRVPVDPLKAKIAKAAYEKNTAANLFKQEWEQFKKGIFAEEEQVSELFNKPYPTTPKDDDNFPDDWHYEFSTDDGSKYVVSVYDPYDYPMIAFAQLKNGEYVDDTTNTGDAFKILATVGEVTKKFVDDMEPDQFSFAGTVDDPSRLKLYDRIAQYIKKVSPDYKNVSINNNVRFTGGKVGKEYVFHRSTFKKGVDEGYAGNNPAIGKVKTLTAKDIKGKYTDDQLIAAGFKKEPNGNFTIPLLKWNKLRSTKKLEDYDPNGPPPGPEFKPTMPAGTVKVDVSDVYDWYKLGQHISNLKGLGKHDFGQGPPSTILSFGDEDTEHKYIQDLEKTGLATTDIDPFDPNQPKGMKRQKTDPTYNVNETDNRKAAVLKIQKHLNKKYGANLDLDGKLGPLTLKSINKFMPRAKSGLADEPNKTTAVQGKKLKEADNALDITFTQEPYEGWNGMGLMITAYSGGDEIGHVIFEPTDNDKNKWYATEVEVEDKFQRKGIATAMYDMAKKMAQKSNAVIVPSHAQTSDAKGMWKNKKVWEASDYSQYESKIEDFVQSLNPDDVGVEQIGPYHVHFEGFTDECQQDAEKRCNLPSDNPRHLASYDDVYKEVIRDFARREGGKKPLKVGFAGYQDYPVIYAVFDNPEPYKNPDAWNPKIDEAPRTLQSQVTPLEKLVQDYGYLTTFGMSHLDKQGATPEAQQQLLVLVQRLSKDGKTFANLDKQKMETNRDTILSHIHSMMQYAIPVLKKNLPADKWEAKRSQINSVLTAYNNARQINEASGYIPSAKEKNDPRFKTALTVDVKPDAIKKNAKAFGFKTSRAGIPPQARADGKINESVSQKSGALVNEFLSTKTNQERRFYAIRDNCGPAASDMRNWLENTKGIKTKRVRGEFVADDIVSKKADFTPDMKKEFISAGLDWNSPEDRYNFIKNNPKYATEWKKIPHYWLTDESGEIYDPTGYIQFINPGLATDLNKRRYIPESQARADGKIAEDLMREFKTFLGEQQEEMFPGYDEQHREKRLSNWLAKSWGVQNGKPQTFYHATTKDFDTFNTHGTGFASALGMAYEVERHGSFFAVDPKFAEGFIEDPNTGRVKEGGRVLPVHLSIQSPIDLRDDALSRMLSDEETVEEFKANDIDLRSIYNHFYELERWELFDGPEGAEFIDNLQKLGFDGAIINEAIPNNSNAKSGQVWVAFSPNQVKSVYNRGSFSPDDPRLTKESG